MCVHSGLDIMSVHRPGFPSGPAHPFFKDNDPEPREGK